MMVGNYALSIIIQGQWQCVWKVCTFAQYIGT
jgi:hypothetical protein